MALTTAAEIQLQNASFIKGFEDNKAIWLGMAKEAYAYTAKTVTGSPKPDDVAPHLELALEARDEFIKLKSNKGARPKYWNRRFADLIVSKVWIELT
jgi:hypothetical protein